MDDNTGRSIGRTPGTPEWLVVSSSSSSYAPVHKPASTGITTDAGLLFNATTASANTVQALQADGFPPLSQARTFQKQWMREARGFPAYAT